MENKIESGEHIDSVTIGEVESLIQEAYKEGFKGEDGFLLAVDLSY